MTRRSRIMFILLFYPSLAFLLAAAVAALVPFAPVGKLIGTGGILLAISGALQLEVTGFVDKIIEIYSDEKIFPYGPPSHHTRELLAINPIEGSWLVVAHSSLFSSPKIGYWMTISGAALGIPAIWL